MVTAWTALQIGHKLVGLHSGLQASRYGEFCGCHDQIHSRLTGKQHLPRYLGTLNPGKGPDTQKTLLVFISMRAGCAKRLDTEKEHWGLTSTGSLTKKGFAGHQEVGCLKYAHVVSDITCVSHIHSKGLQ